MCLGVPGKVESIEEDATGVRMGKVNFMGVKKDICLAYVPEVQVGDYVIVHVGFAISKLDENEALEVFEYLRQMSSLSELDAPAP
ncbi:MAG: HypC/HybG/HupF family hydrogenase formation chaperone [Chloroflexota bacterium]